MKEKLKEAGGKCLGCVVGVIVVGLLIYFGMQCEKKHTEKYPWKGAFYHKVNDDFLVTEDGEFKTVDECRSWASDLASSKNYQEGEWKFSCGTNCEFSDKSVISGTEVHTYDCQEVVTE